MRVGIVGAGRIGEAVAARLVTGGHEVMLANSREPETLADLEQSLGQNAQAGTIEQAIGFGEVVVVAIPLHAIDALPTDLMAGHIVIDANNYYPGRDGEIAQLDTGELGSSELLAQRLPGARVVKAFNTMNFARLRDGGRPHGAQERLAIPLAGDDASAKQAVSQLIDDMGFDPVDAGTLSDGRRQQPGTPVYGQLLDAEGVRRVLDET
jgi:predicted dinucleotide-binding enzyme